MKLFMHLAQLFVGEMGVNLRGRDGSVAKHVLHGAEVRAAEEEVGGKRMPYRMWRYFFDESRHARGFAHDVFDGDRGEAAFFVEVEGGVCSL